jgi:polyhydroxyalkanoate synthesis regulator phasin
MRKSLQKIAGRVAQSGLETAGAGAIALGRTAWLLGLGAAASAGEAGVAMFDALVEKGRRRRESPVEKAQRALSEGGTQIVKLAGDAGKVAQKRVTEMLADLGLPSRVDVRELARRVEALRQKLA